MIVFQTPTHPVIINNLGWCFFVETFVKTFQDVAKVEHLWKKGENNFGKLHNKLFGFAKGKKTSTFFLKDLCQIYFVQKTKKTFLKTSCSKSKYWLFWFTKKKRKTRPLLTKLWLKWKNSAHFVWGKVCLWQIKTKQRTLAFGKKKALFCFVFFRVIFSLTIFFSKFSKWRKQKNKQTRSEFFFLFIKTTMLLYKTIKPFFVSQLPKINKPLVQKKVTIFSCLRSWEVMFLPKQCEHQRFVTKSNEQFHFFVTPTHQVMIVITNFNVFEHPTQV